jgi:gamma-glutamyltranspeptidase/glutathione hydrolase
LPICFEPAIRYARDGLLPFLPIVAEKWALAMPHMPRDLGWFEHFIADMAARRCQESALRAARFRATLERIALTDGEAFYRGELAQAMVRHAKSASALHTLEDFAAHTANWVKPLGLSYRGVTVHEIPPNGQGISALAALGVLDNFDLASMPPDSPAAQHLLIEAMKLGFADAYRYVSDIDHMTVTPEALLDRAYLASRARLIDRQRAQNFGPGEPPRSGTVYLCAGDQDGMLVSLIQSNYMGFGSGVVVPDTGISLQNRGTGFSLTPGHPNEVGGGKRPYHTIIPGFVTRDGQPLAAFGVMGGPIQPPGHVQTIVRLVDYHMNPQAVLDAPRWKLAPSGAVDLEASASPELRAKLIAMGHVIADQPDSYMDFGAGQFIVKTDEGYVAASDPRRDGKPRDSERYCLIDRRRTLALRSVSESAIK